MRHRLHFVLIAGTAAAILACADHSITGAAPQKGQGSIAMQLTDGPSALDSIASVNIFVVRVDARVKVADSTVADSSTDGDGDFGDREHAHRDSTAWVTIASPNKAINIMALTGSDTAFLGATAVDSGMFRSFRIIIDPSKSNVVLKNGLVLTDSTTPSVEFFSRGRHGILVDLDSAADVHEGTTTTITLDFRLGESIFLKGRTVSDGLVIRAVVRGNNRGDDHDGH